MRGPTCRAGGVRSFSSKQGVEISQNAGGERSELRKRWKAEGQHSAKGNPQTLGGASREVTAHRRDRSRVGYIGYQGQPTNPGPLSSGPTGKGNALKGGEETDHHGKLCGALFLLICVPPKSDAGTSAPMLGRQLDAHTQRGD